MNTGLIFLLRSILRNRELITQMTIREIAIRHKNSVLGVLWMLGQPLLQLMLYSFVFQIVLRARWGDVLPNGTEIPFGLTLYAGLVLHGILADTLVRSPSLILSNPSYVKKVIFPLETLCIVSVMSALVGGAMGLVILFMATAYLSDGLPLSIFLIPLPIISLTLMSLGCGWILAALGVFLRDLGQITPVLASVLLFTAPICYPLEAVPEQYHFLMAFNPLTIPVEALRALLFDGTYTHWNSLAIYGLLSVMITIVGYMTFHRLRAGFADAI